LISKIKENNYTKKIELSKSFPSEEDVEKGAYILFGSRIASNGIDKIFISDTRANKVIQVDGNCNYTKEIGKKGQGPGDLIGPYNILYYDNKLITSENGNMRVQYFNSDGKYMRGFKLYKGYTSIDILNNKLYCAVIIRKNDDKLINVLDENGIVIKSFGDPFNYSVDIGIMNQCVLAVYNNEIFVAFVNLPIIRRYTFNGELIKEIYIDDEISKSKSKFNKESNDNNRQSINGQKRGYTRIINSIKVYKERIYYLVTYPRTEIIEINKDGQIMNVYWSINEVGYDANDFVVLEENNEMVFYILKFFPDQKVDKFIIQR